MAVIQISKIQVRRGLEENLPQLGAGEFGWATDTRRLFIGNGVTGSPDYSPDIGNTEVLTVFAADALSLRLDAVEANIANIHANISTINSTLTNLSVSSFTLAGNTWVASSTPIVIQSLTSKTIDYSIVRGNNIRIGSIKVAQYNGSTVYNDDYTETASLGVTLVFQANTANIASANLSYTASNTVPVTNATFNYYLKPYA